MGGRELNFGSDLDLVFVYGEDGRTDKGRSNLQFFVELCQSIVNDFGRLTRNGSLYEIDARLRPEGGNALLALSFDTYNTYLTNRAKTWERLALSRSRTVAGDADLGKRMLDRFEQFVVGEGLSSSDLEEILDVRARMEKKDVGLLSIKTGPGGIVDIEFLVQVLQIRHARSHPGIRTPATREGLRRLADAGLFHTDEAAVLDENLVFLRTVEKILRRQDVKGKTRLPKDRLALQVIARADSRRFGGVDDGFEGSNEDQSRVVRPVYGNVKDRLETYVWRIYAEEGSVCCDCFSVRRRSLFRAGNSFGKRDRCKSVVR